MIRAVAQRGEEGGDRLLARGCDRDRIKAGSRQQRRVVELPPEIDTLQQFADRLVQTGVARRQLVQILRARRCFQLDRGMESLAQGAEFGGVHGGVR